MRLLAKVLVDRIGEYLPGLDTEQLRVDVLNGRCFVEDADCTRGPITSFVGIPFRLAAGHIGSLELSVPWKSLSSAPVKLCAKNVSLRFEEISFPNHLSEVRDAFRAARIREKLRKIADGEKRESIVQRLLRRLLPLILDRVEVDLSNISVEFTLSEKYHISLNLGSISTKENSLSLSGDLSKQLCFTDISLDVYQRCDSNSSQGDEEGLVDFNFVPGKWTRKQVLYFPKVEAGLRVDGGSFSAILDVPCAVTVKLDSVLVGVLVSLKRNHYRWELLLSEKPFLLRPNHSPSSNPSAWWAYAVHLVTRENNGLSYSSCCDEYRKLYIRRLTLGQKLEPSDFDRITELEDLLDVGTLVSLRAQASNTIFVDGASSFAAGDMLSRVLSRDKLSDEREAIGSEIRQALESLERYSEEFGQSSDLPSEPIRNSSISGIYAKAIVTASVHRIDLSFSHELSRLDFTIAGIKFWTEADSSLSNYAAVVHIDSCTVRNGSFVLFRRLKQLPVESDKSYRWRPSSRVAPTPTDDTLFALQIRKMPLDRSVTISAKVTDVHLSLDVAGLSPLLRNLAFVRSSFSSFLNGYSTLNAHKNFDVVPSDEDRSQLAIVFYAQLAGVTVSASCPGISKTDPSLEKNGCKLVIGRSFVEVEWEGEVRKMKAGTRLQFSVYRLMNSKMLSYRSEELCWEIIDEFPLSFKYQRNLVLVETGDLNMRLTCESAEILGNICSIVKGEITPFLGSNLQVQSNELRSDLPHDTSRISSQRILVEVPSVFIALGGKDIGCEVHLTMKYVTVGFRENGKLRISMRDLVLGEKGNRALLHVFPTTGDDCGVEIAYSTTYNNSNSNYNSTNVDDLTNLRELACVKVGNGSMLISTGSLSRVLSTILQYTTVVHDVLYSGSEVRLHQASTPANYESSVEFLIDVDSLAIELMGGDIRALFRAEGGRYSLLKGRHSGFLQTAELLDLSSKSADYCRAIQSVHHDSEDPSSGKCFSFRVEEGNLFFELSGLQFTLLRFFLDELAQIIGDITSVFKGFTDVLESSRSVYDTNDSGSRDEEVRSHETTDTLNTRTSNIAAKFLQITVPIHKSSTGAIRLDIEDGELSFGSNSKEMVLREVGLLSRPSQSSPHVSRGASSNHSPAHLDWATLFRNLSLELKHEEHSFFQDPSSSFDSSERPNKTKSHFSVAVLSEIYVLIAPSQISLISSAISQLMTASPAISSVGSQTNSHSHSRHRADSDLMTARTGNDTFSEDIPAPGHYCEHLFIDVCTESIAIDLLQEDDHGAVIATIANITLGRCNYSFESIRDSSSDSDTKVTHQRLYVNSLVLEDHRQSTPSHLSLILLVPRELSSSESSTFESDVLPSAIRVESLTRIERGQEKSSAKLEILDPLMCWSPGLIDALVVFVSDSTSTDVFDGSTASSATISDSDSNHVLAAVVTDPRSASASAAEQTLSTITADPTVSVKYSISIVRPIVFIPFQTPVIDQYGLKLTSPYVKISLLAGKDGLLIRGSSIRSKCVNVSMQQQGDVPFSDTSNQFGDVDEWQLNLGQRTVVSGSRRRSFMSDDMTLDGNSYLDENRKPPALLTWYKDQTIPALVAVVTNLAIKIPASVNDSWSISVWKLNVERTGLVDLLQFVSLFEFLSLVPAVGGYVGDGVQEPIAPIEVSVQNVLLRAVVPFADANVANRSYILRIRGGVELRFGRDMEYVTAEVRLSADISSEGGAMFRDQLFAPCTARVKVHPNTAQVSVSVPRTIQVTISPLTVKTVARIAVLIDQHFKQVDELRKASSFDAAFQLALSGQDGRPKYLINIGGIVLSLVAEEPRAHLMRLVFRNIKCFLKLPVDGLSWGGLECDIGDIILEDVISSRLYGHDNNGNGVEWRTMFSSATDLVPRELRHRYLEILPPTIPESEREDLGALALVQSFRQLDLDERQRSLQPCAVVDSSQEELPSATYDSFVSVRAKWQHPIQHLSMHLVVKPLDIHLNSAILPSLLAWTMTISEALDSVLKKRETAPTSPQSYFATGHYTNDRTIGIDRLIIEPIVIRIATKAPPKPLETSAFRRLLDWFIGAEFMTGLTLESERISFGGNFDSFDSLLRRIQLEYRAALLSRSMVRQLLVQISALSTLTRVGASTILRGNRSTVIQSASTPTSSLISNLQDVTHTAVGLAALVSEYETHNVLSSTNQLLITGGMCVVTRLQPPIIQSVPGILPSDDVEIVEYLP